MSVIPLFQTQEDDDRDKGAAAIHQLLDHAAVLAREQELTELAFLIGVASEAAADIAAGKALDSAS